MKFTFLTLFITSTTVLVNASGREKDGRYTTASVLFDVCVKDCKANLGDIGLDKDTLDKICKQECSKPAPDYYEVKSEWEKTGTVYYQGRKLNPK